ncbi:TetR/AcrR family transcriptional regulator [Arachidicoccus sp.]|jgi:AcrR family transcriptional regulator|uniref:TetR/AcrR family transcriptional regulator n=1 Tax=Arachidicoccus sp. TaxID=1872624 RepID=UPI003D23D160
MTTREQIIQSADKLIREKGYNAFSFSDISNVVGIKKASIHYHFPQKSDLGTAVINEHILGLKNTINKYKGKSPVEKFEKFISVYSEAKTENKICIVGSVASDLNTIEENMKSKIKEFTNLVLDWVTFFLEEGRERNVFYFGGEGRDKALMIITNMLAIVQLSRVTGEKDFKIVTSKIKEDLLKK